MYDEKSMEKEFYVSIILNSTRWAQTSLSIYSAIIFYCSFDIPNGH